MKKRKTWRSKLTKKEIAHMKESECTTLTELKTTFEHQAKMRKQFPEPMHEPCWDCRAIAKKLDFAV